MQRAYTSLHSGTNHEQDLVTALLWARDHLACRWEGVGWVCPPRFQPAPHHLCLSLVESGLVGGAADYRAGARPALVSPDRLAGGIVGQCVDLGILDSKCVAVQGPLRGLWGGGQAGPTPR